MSFKFNAEVFKDNSFNEKIKEKLTKALNSSSSSSSSSSSAPTVMSPGAGTDDTQGNAAVHPNGIPVAAAAVTDRGARGASTTATTTSVSSNSNIQSRSTTPSRKLDILKSEIIVSNVNFPTMPELEILDLDVNAQPRSLVKGICKISCRDAMLQIQTEIESNLLLVYSDYSPDFTTPTMICKESFTIPITMIFSEIRLEAITDIFVKNSGIGISFNDVNLDFKFDCSIQILQSTIEKRLKKSMQLIFKEVLPSVIFNMSQSLFTQDDSAKLTPESTSGSTFSKADPNCQASSPSPKIVLDESDLQELSPANMLRLSTLISSRQTLSLNATVLNVPSTIPGCLERQNLHRFNSRIPSLSNFYAAFRDLKQQPVLMNRTSSTALLTQNNNGGGQNLLPAKVLENGAYDLSTITNIQSRIFERNTDENIRPRRRKIKLARSKKKSIVKKNAEDDETIQASRIVPADSSSDVCSTLSTCSDDTLVTSPVPIRALKGDHFDGQHGKNNVDDCNLTSIKIPVNMTSRYIAQPDKNLLNFEQQVTSGIESQRKTNILEETNYFSYRPDIHKLRSSIYSPIGRNGSLLTSGKELSEQRQLLENRKLNFVGLNHKGISWGNDDEPPPYIS